MSLYAVVTNNIVINVIVADSQEIAEEATNMTCVEIPEGATAGIGFSYIDNQFVAPVIEEVAPVIEETE
jgi:hypothetical protein